MLALFSSLELHSSTNEVPTQQRAPSLHLLGNKSGLGDMHTNKRKIKDTRFYVVQQKPTSTERTRTQLTL
jgi:hypothetical protein